MQFEPGRPCVVRTSCNSVAPAMTLIEKVALAELLRIWRSWFGDNWATAEHAIKYLLYREERELLYQASLKSGGSEALSRQLDEVRDNLFYNYVVKRDVPYMQPVRWRVLLQDRRVKISEEERNALVAVRREAGLKIDPATREVDWSRERESDPYGIEPLPDEFNLSWHGFARSPGSRIWVSFRDLPDATRKALEETRPREADFPMQWMDRSALMNRRVGAS